MDNNVAVRSLESHQCADMRTHELVTFGSQPLARFCFQLIANLEKFVMEMLDCSFILLLGIFGRGV